MKHGARMEDDGMTWLYSAIYIYICINAYNNIVMDEID